MSPRLTGLWRHPDFVKLWLGQTVSVFGSQITLLALPLTAVLVLKASPGQMGILGAVEFLPFLLLSLFAGVWVDRLRRRSILIVADAGRAVLLGLVPVAAWWSFLSMEFLYIVALLTGILTVFFDVAYQAYLPSLVERDQLVEGNSKLVASQSVSQIAGPGLAGTLVQLLTAPFAMLIDALSFVVSVVFLALIRKPEPVVERPTEKRSIFAEIGEGLGVIFGSRYLRSIAGCTGTGNYFSNVAFSVYALFAVRELNLEPALIGIIFACGSVGGLVGALVAARVARRFSLGAAIIVGSFLSGFGLLLVPLAGAISYLAIIILIVSQFIGLLGGVIYNINQVSLRQTITPTRLQGRMNASMRFIVWGTIPLGALTGGILGDTIGLRATLLVAGVGGFFSFLWVFLSPVRALQENPTPPDELTVTT